MQFTTAVKLVFGVFEVAAGVVGYRFVKRQSGRDRAHFVLCGLVLNPALLLDSTHWGQLDSLHTLLTILGLIGLCTREWGWGWAALTLAALSKPRRLP